MQTTISATRARVHFGEVMQDAMRRQQPIVVEKAGKPQVVILAYDLYQQLVGAEDNDWRVLMAAGHALVREDLQGKKLPSGPDMIDAAREARNEELANLR